MGFQQCDFREFGVFKRTAVAFFVFVPRLVVSPLRIPGEWPSLIEFAGF